MKKILILSFISCAILSADSFKNDIGYNIFILNNNFIRSGHYDIKDKKLNNMAHIFSYSFKFSKKYQPFIIAGFGTSDFSNRNSSFDSKFIKAGLGFKYNYSNNLTLSTAFSRLWLDSDIKGAYVKDYSINSKNSINDFYITLKHKNYLNEKTIVESLISLHHQKIFYDTNIKSVKGLSLNSQVSLINKNITKLYDLNVSTRVYLNATFLDDKLSKVAGFDYAGGLGANLYVNIAKFIPVFKDITKDLNLDFSVQYTKGNNGFKGYEIGVGFKLLKY